MIKEHEIQKVICACYLYAPNDDVRNQIEAIVSQMPLTEPQYDHVYHAMVDCRHAGAPFGREHNTLESLGVVERLRDANKWDRDTFVEIVTFETHWMHWEYYLEKWKEISYMSQLMHTAAKIGDNYHDPHQCLKLADDMKHYSETFGPRDDAKHIGDVLIDVMTDLEKPEETNTEFATGYADLDKSLAGGLTRGHLHILAARPGVGKTTFAINLANRIKKRCLFLSLEMKSEELVKRVLSLQSGIPLYKLRHQVTDAMEAGREVTEKEVYLIHNSQLTMADVKALVSMHKPDYLIVDYLTLLTHQNRQLPRYEQVGDFSRGLKRLALQADIPVVALAQLRRDVEQGNRKPRLSDLRESGNIEQDADVVMLLHNSEPENVSQGVQTQLILAKNRQGARRTIDLVFFGARCAFEMQAPERNHEFDEL